MKKFGKSKFKNRTKMPYKKSKRLFTKTAKKVHSKNAYLNPMRGGIRL